MSPESDDIKGGVYVVPGSAHARELAKFEQFPTYFAPTPGNPYVYRPFPKMLYKAKHFRGKVACIAEVGRPSDYSSPQEYQQTMADVDSFNRDCQRIVNDELEMSRAMEDGWRESPQEAVDFVHARDKAISTAAAERAYKDSKMSELAQREAAQAEEEADGMHLPEIPEKRKRGRPRKDAA